MMQNMAFANENRHSVNTTGMLGLNTIPSARMDALGTARLGFSHSDPYNHAFLGMQVAKPLYINLRQSAEVSSVGEKPWALYPGIDLKLRLSEEGRYVPELVFGMDSATGHRRHSSEYFALSKRIYDFDFTGGVAWGRLGSAGQIPNPLARIGHFNHDRDFSDEDAAGPRDWFTGKEIGFFAGVEYFTPIKGFSFKADIGADDYPAEQKFTDYKKPGAWSVGFNYSPRDWVSMGASVIGGDKIMARLTLQDNFFNWRGTFHKDTPASQYVPYEATKYDEKAVTKEGGKNFINLGSPQISGTNISAILYINEDRPSSMQIGRAARSLAACAPENIESLTVIPMHGDLKGKAITFSRRDIDQTMAQKRGSPEEIWQDITFTTTDRSTGTAETPRKFKFFPELEFSLAEEGTSHLYRTSIVAEESKHYKYGLFASSSLRFNLRDRLYQIDKMGMRGEKPVRSDANDYAGNFVNLERSFLSWMTTPLPDFHLAATAGYLEEMYAGVGGEALYRPFDSPFAIGAEIWRVNKRLGQSFMAMGLEDEARYTGHLNLFYDVPDTDITIYANAGRYLGGDNGVTGGLETQFGNVTVKAFVTATDTHDRDQLGETAALYGGINITLPLGNIPFVPEGSAARIKTGQLGRDAGQALDKPVSLYEVTEPMSYRHLGRSWQAVLK
jgi:Exopolysaccharide biosynthesis protein YbjH